MPRTRLKYVLLSIFIGSILFLIFLQFNANQSITDLIGGNNQLKNELLLKNSLQKLQSDLLSLDSKIKGAVIANDTQHLVRIEKEIELIQQDIEGIEKNNDAINEDTRHLYRQLKELVSEKAMYSNSIIDTLNKKGKNAAELIINRENENALTARILAAIQQLDESSENDAITFSNKTDAESKKALNWGFITVTAACIFGLIAFIFISGRIKKQEQLIKALDEAHKKEKELAMVKEQFLANMSHEIRTPMNAVLGFAGLLQKQDLNPASREYVNSIVGSGENLMNIINDILDISKIEAGMLRIEKAPFSLRELIHSVEVMFQSRLDEKSVVLSASVAEDVPDYLMGDAMRLTQMLVNLISNAVKFTQKGRITIAVKKIKDTETTATIEIQVSDTGIGINKEKLTTIFERFVQADADTTRQYGGTGLGLAIVKQLAQLQNGSIEATSSPGNGSCFTLTIPFEMAAEEMKSAALQQQAKQQFINQPIRILIAEDNTMNQALMKHLMNDWKIPYQLVTNGKEALELMRIEAFDLLLLDIQMPLMNGYTTAQLIRTELNSSVPIIAMTAHAMAGEKEKCISYGMNDYISKPIREEELLQLINKYIPQQKEISHTSLQVKKAGSNHSFKMIQLDYLHQLSNGNKDFEKAMAEEFLIQVPEQLTRLKEAVDAVDYKTIRTLAHNMKTSVAFLGLTETLNPVLEKIEQTAAAKNEITIINSNYQHLNAVCTEAIAETKEYVQSF
jgi:signal transduction histidine kinase/DNA-binding response OmpR family regulator